MFCYYRIFSAGLEKSPIAPSVTGAEKFRLENIKAKEASKPCVWATTC